nr:Uncharacterised protein [Klebsiella pneumoniae]
MIQPSGGILIMPGIRARYSGWGLVEAQATRCQLLLQERPEAKPCRNSNQVITLIPSGIKPKRLIICARRCASLFTVGTVAKLAMRQPLSYSKALHFKTLLTGRISPGDHHNKMLRPAFA